MSLLGRLIVDPLRPVPDRPVEGDPEAQARRYRAWRWSVFLSILLGYAMFYTTRLSFPVCKKALLDAGVLNPDQMGKVGFALLIAYAAGKFANGLLADHVNPARFFAAGLFLSAATNWIFGSSQSYLLFLVLWTINGWVQSMGAPVCGVVMSSWFSNRERGTRYSVWSTSHNIGETLSFAFISRLVSRAGWRWGFYGPGLLCGAGSLVMLRTLSDRPTTRGLPPIGLFNNDQSGRKEDARIPLGELQREVLRNPRVWLLAISSALMYIPRYGVNHWGILYLQEEKSFSQDEAGYVTALFPLVGIAGSALSGIISDRLFRARRAPVTLAYGLLFVLSLYFLFFTPITAPWVLHVSMASAGFSIGGLLVFLGGLTAMDFSSKRASGAAMGLVGGVSYVGAAIQDWLAGRMIEGGRRVVGNRTIYDFSSAKQLWMGSAILSVLLPLTLWRAERGTADLQESKR